MGLGFSQGGDFKPYVAYNAKAGKWSMKKDGVETEIEKPTFVADFAKIKTGWFYYAAGQAPQVVLNPSLTNKVPRPAGEGSDGKPLYKEGFKLDLFSKASFTGVAEFSSSAMLVRDAIGKLYDEYEKGVVANPGMLPVVESHSTQKVVGKHGTNYAPVFKIAKWVARPAELDSTAPAETNTVVPMQKVVSEF